MKAMITVVRCLSCDYSIPREAVVKAVGNDPASPRELVLLLVALILDLHIEADGGKHVFHRPIVENIEMVCKHHGPGNCACSDPSVLITASEYASSTGYSH